MKRYLRPLGILSGQAAHDAISAGLAEPLAGGPLAYALVEVIERDGGTVVRRIERSPAFTAAAVDELDVTVMAIVNATPDSFSDGGAFFDPAKAIAHAEAMIRAGAKIIDIGGESTRPGAQPVAPDEEIRRVLPVIAGLRTNAEAAGAILSIDTRNARTMQAAIDAGVGMVNDVSALTHDPDSSAVVAGSHVLVVLMHMRGEPATMQQAPVYDDVALDVYDYLEARIAAAEAAGIKRNRIIVDPGIGFGKTVGQNLALLDQLSMFHGLGVPLLVGVSRKGFIGRVSAGEAADRRLAGSLAAGLAAIRQGARIIRVHDVAETMQALRVVAAINNSRVD